MSSVIKLIDAICVSWDNSGYAPIYSNGTLQVTYCNLFVNDVAVALGCTDFHDPMTGIPKTADEIVEFVQMASDWQEMRCSGLGQADMAQALRSIQGWANAGYLTIAGATGATLGSNHGHVCVVRPGTMKSSGKWGEVPSVANVGKENFIGRAKSGPMKGSAVGINEAFIQMPRFWSWRGI